MTLHSNPPEAFLQWLATKTGHIRYILLTLCLGASSAGASAQVVTGSLSDQGLYFVSTGHVYYAENSQATGQPISEGALLLRSANGKPLTATAWLRGLPLLQQTGSKVVATKAGTLIKIAWPNFVRPRGAAAPVFSSLSLHDVDATTGRIKTRILSKKQLASIWQTESELGADLDADGVLGSRIYVNGTATGTNTGQTWTNAFNSLQDALDLASSGMEIWIARGTYKPSKLPRIATLLGISNAPKLHMFELKSGVALYGGFSGAETKLNDRNIDANPTVLSGDHLGNDEWPPTLENQSLFYDNAYSVVLAYQLRPAPRLDGLIITAGNAYAFSDRELHPSTRERLPSGQDNRIGGGIFALSSDLIIADCTIRRNMALDGGGLAAYAGPLPLEKTNGQRVWSKARPGSKLTVTDTLFEENLVPDYHLSKLFYNAGGAAHIGINYIASFRNVEFISNSASSGGAVRLSGGYGSPATPEARFVNCVFYRNEAICSPDLPDPYGDGYLTDGSGGALDAGGRAVFAIAGSLFLENTALNPRGYVAASGLSGGHGGAISISLAAKGRIASSVIVQNRTEQAGGAISLANWDGYPRGAALEIYHCILHANAGRWSGGIFNYGRALLRGHGNIFYENMNSYDTVVDVDNFQGSSSSFSSTLLTQNSILSNNTGARNVYLPSGQSIFVDPASPAGADSQWGTSDDGYRLAPEVLTPITQAPPPDFADADGDGNFLEPLPLDAKGDSFGSAPFDLGAYQSP